MAENYDIPAPKKRKLSLQINPKIFEKATDEEKRQQDVMAESTTFFRDGMRRLLHNPLAVISLIILLLVILTMIFAPKIVPYSYDEIITVEGGPRQRRGEHGSVPVFAAGTGLHGKIQC